MHLHFCPWGNNKDNNAIFNKFITMGCLPLLVYYYKLLKDLCLHIHNYSLTSYWTDSKSSITQQIKHLSNKHKDLRSIRSTHVKTQVWWYMLLILQHQGGRVQNHGSSLLSQFSSIAKFQVPEGDPVSTKKVNSS